MSAGGGCGCGRGAGKRSRVTRRGWSVMGESGGGDQEEECACCLKGMGEGRWRGRGTGIKESVGWQVRCNFGMPWHVRVHAHTFACTRRELSLS